MSTPIHIRTSSSQPFVVLPTSINDRGPFDFVLDTGAGISIVTENLAASLAIQDIEVKDGLDAGGKKIDVTVGIANSIAVGDSKVENAKVGIIRALPKRVGDGVLGYDFLKHYVLTIDYPHRVVTLTSPTEEKAKHTYLSTILRLRLARPDRPIILMDGIVNSGNSYQFVLDTGASQTVVSPALSQEAGVRSKQRNTIVGAGGPVASSVGMLKSIHIGHTFVENVLVAVADVFSPLNQAAGTMLDGILGYNILHQFTLTIDYPNETLHLQKEQSSVQNSERRNSV